MPWYIRYTGAYWLWSHFYGLIAWLALKIGVTAELDGHIDDLAVGSARLMVRNDALASANVALHLQNQSELAATQNVLAALLTSFGKTTVDLSHDLFEATKGAQVSVTNDDVKKTVVIAIVPLAQNGETKSE